MPNSDLLGLLLTLPTVRDARLSPDGRWVAFVWYRVHANMDVFLVPSDGSAPPVALTHTPEATTLVSWAPDSQSVLVAEDHDRDERARLFRVRLDQPLIMEPLTEDRPPYFIRGGALSPDGQTLYYAANYDFATQQTLEPTWVYRHDLTTGQRTPIAQPQRPAFSWTRLNRQGTHLLYPRKDRHPSGIQVHLVDLVTGEDRELLNFGGRVKVVAQWLPDGATVVVLSESKDGQPQTHRSLGLLHVPSGRLTWLIDDPDRNIESLKVSPDGVIIVNEIREARHVATWLDPATGFETPFPRLAGNLLPIGRAADGAWLALHYSATSPIDVVRLTDETTPQTLTQVWQRTPLTPDQFTPAEDFRWTSVDGLAIQGWLYRALPNPRRAIIYVHGGPTAHSEDALNPQLHYFVSQGFNVLDVNYRGSTGFGLRYRELIKEDGWGGREQADIATGAAALIQAGLAEPGRVGVTGTSYGGYSAWCQITHTPVETIAAAAPICGMTDLVVDYQTTRPDLRPYSEEMIGGRPDEITEKYHGRSPINFVDNIAGRLLIVQGAQDPNVTPENVRQVVARLEAAGIPYELLEFEDEGHGILKPANQERLYTCLVTFFDAALGKEGWRCLKDWIG